MYFRILLSGVALTVLTACGGGGGGGGGGTGNGIVHSTSFSTVRAETIQLFNAVDRTSGGAAESYVQVSSLPTSDSVSYEGVVEVIQTGAPLSADGYFSPVSLTADFTSPDAAISGAADQFYRSARDTGNEGLPSTTGTAVGGSLDFDADLDSFSGTFSVNVSGSLDFDGNGSAEGSINDTLNGQFIGATNDDPEFFLASGNGISVSGAAISSVNIGLAAEQQP